MTDDQLQAARASLLATCLDVLAHVHAQAAREDVPPERYADELVLSFPSVERQPFGIRPAQVVKGKRTGVYVCVLSVAQVADLAETLAEQLGIGVDVPPLSLN